MLPKQSIPPDHGTSTSVLADSTDKCGSSVLLSAAEIERCVAFLPFWINGIVRRLTVENKEVPPNVNVTLDQPSPQADKPLVEWFPCPLCSSPMPIRLTGKKTKTLLPLFVMHAADILPWESRDRSLKEID